MILNYSTRYRARQHYTYDCHFTRVMTGSVHYPRDTATTTTMQIALYTLLLLHLPIAALGSSNDTHQPDNRPPPDYQCILRDPFVRGLVERELSLPDHSRSWPPQKLVQQGNVYYLQSTTGDLSIVTYDNHRKMSPFMKLLLDNACFHNRHRDDPFAMFFNRVLASAPGRDIDTWLLAAFYQADGGAASMQREHKIDC